MEIKRSEFLIQEFFFGKMMNSVTFLLKIFANKETFLYLEHLFE